MDFVREETYQGRCIRLFVDTRRIETPLGSRLHQQWLARVRLPDGSVREVREAYLPAAEFLQKLQTMIFTRRL